MELNREYGRIYTFMHPEVGENLNRIRRKMYEGKMYASGVDLEKQNQDAVDIFMKATKQEQ